MQQNRNGKAFPARPQIHIEAILRDLDPDKMLHVPYVPFLHMRARPGFAVGAALATVRAEGTDGGAPGSATGFLPRGAIGLPSATASPTLGRRCDEREIQEERQFPNRDAYRNTRYFIQEQYC